MNSSALWLRAWLFLVPLFLPSHVVSLWVGNLQGSQPHPCLHAHSAPLRSKAAPEHKPVLPNPVSGKFSVLWGDDGLGLKSQARLRFPGVYSYGHPCEMLLAMVWNLWSVPCVCDLSGLNLSPGPAHPRCSTRCFGPKPWPLSRGLHPDAKNHSWPGKDRGHSEKHSRALSPSGCSCLC